MLADASLVEADNGCSRSIVSDLLMIMPCLAVAVFASDMLSGRAAEVSVLISFK